MKGAKRHYKACEHDLKHRLQVCLVSASVIMLIGAAVTLFWGQVETTKLVALVVIVLAIPLFMKSHVIAGRLVVSLEDPQSNPLHDHQKPLRQKLEKSLHRRNMKPAKKCLPYRYHQSSLSSIHENTGNR